MSCQETFPPGFEQLLETSLGNVVEATPPTLLNLLIPPIHWSIIRCNQRLQLDCDGGSSELLPSDWRAKMSINASRSSLVLNYRTQIGDQALSDQVSEIKIMEIQKDKLVIVNRKGHGTIILSFEDYIDPSKVAQLPNLTLIECFRKTLWKLEELVKDFLFEHEVVLGQQWHASESQRNNKSPYDMNMMREQIEEADSWRHKEQTKEQRHAYQSPLYDPPFAFSSSDPFRIGRSDLDPFSGMDGGMLMDPRGFRTGGGRHLDSVGSSRFDPFGPVMPRGEDGKGMFQGAPAIPFGCPDNDIEMPNRDEGYDEMFM